MDPVFVHERVFVTPDRREHVERVVECPDRGVIPFSQCERCPHFFEVGMDERYGGEVVDCARAPACEASAIPRHVDRTASTVDVVTTVGDIMTRAFVALDPGVPADVARRYLVDEQIGCVLVLDAQRYPIGIATLRDLVEKPDVDQRTIGDLASSPVMTVPQALPVARAAAIMSFEGVHHLAVVDTTGAASGVLSSLDVLRWLGHRAGNLIPRATARQRRAAAGRGPRDEH